MGDVSALYLKKEELSNLYFQRKPHTVAPQCITHRRCGNPYRCGAAEACSDWTHLSFKNFLELVANARSAVRQSTTMMMKHQCLYGDRLLLVLHFQGWSDSLYDLAHSLLQQIIVELCRLRHWDADLCKGGIPVVMQIVPIRMLKGAWEGCCNRYSFDAVVSCSGWSQAHRLQTALNRNIVLRPNGVWFAKRDEDQALLQAEANSSFALAKHEERNYFSNSVFCELLLFRDKRWSIVTQYLSEQMVSLQQSTYWLVDQLRMQRKWYFADFDAMRGHDVCTSSQNCNNNLTMSNSFYAYE